MKLKDERGERWIGGIHEGRPEFIVVGIYLQPAGMNIQPGFILRARRFLARLVRRASPMWGRGLMKLAGKKECK